MNIENLKSDLWKRLTQEHVTIGTAMQNALDIYQDYHDVDDRLALLESLGDQTDQVQAKEHQLRVQLEELETRLRTWLEALGAALPDLGMLLPLV